MSGGGQEKGLRSGTLAPHLCVGLGEAARIAIEEMEFDANHIKKLNKKFYDTINKNLSHLVLNGDKV
jgi:cysteine desulfurase